MGRIGGGKFCDKICDIFAMPLSTADRRQHDTSTKPFLVEKCILGSICEFSKELTNGSQDKRRNARSLLEIGLLRVILTPVCEFLLSWLAGLGARKAKKVRTKRFYTPPFGGKKRRASVFPPKRIFCKPCGSGQPRQREGESSSRSGPPKHSRRVYF